jgi:hypothetical protein
VGYIATELLIGIVVSTAEAFQKKINCSGQESQMADKREERSRRLLFCLNCMGATHEVMALVV